MTLAWNNRNGQKSYEQLSKLYLFEVKIKNFLRKNDKSYYNF
jgi:hypothetical protein